MFKKYMHIEKIGNEEVDGILDGKVYIYPKIDGTNASVWTEDGIIKAGSRNRELTFENDNAGFYQFVSSNKKLNKFFRSDNQDIRLYGEWLVPHTLKTYREDAWRKFYVFDVELDGIMMRYESYKYLLDLYGIEYITPLAIVENANVEYLSNFIDRNTYLIQDCKGVGEGIVIKNYDFVNKYGKQTWGKIVSNEFKDSNRKSFKLNSIKLSSSIEKDIINEYVTMTLIDKEYEKIKISNNGWSSKLIPRLLNTIYYCLINEELWNILKKKKEPTINFKILNNLCNNKVKELKQDLF